MSKKRVLFVVGLLGLVAIVSVSVTIYLLLNQTITQDTNLDNDVSDLTEELGFERDIALQDESDLVNYGENLDIDLSSTLTESEINDLVFMREEEKLARDVYLYLYNLWNTKIFENIAASEQSHTDSIKSVIELYDLEDPSLEAQGEFTNATLSTLYTQLITKGSTSVEDALKVGALIEDLDIIDLENAMSRTDNATILTVYQNLQKGSRNHLRSFTDTLKRYGETYTPTYLTNEEYIQIITSPYEKGNVSGNTSSNVNKGGNN